MRLPGYNEGETHFGQSWYQYFDGAEVSPTGEGVVVKNVVCCHEQDNGILWKHTNTPTGRAAITRQRLLVLQTIITVGNYDYIFAWHFDQVGGIHLESRATGILSTGPIDPGKKSPYGTVVAPGVLGTSHQHFINLRIGELLSSISLMPDPAVDGHKNTIVQEDVVADPPSEVNAHGIGFRVQSKPITVSGFADASPLTGRSFKIVSLM
jgi:primary-amine oxidase